MTSQLSSIFKQYKMSITVTDTNEFEPIKYLNQHAECVFFDKYTSNTLIKITDCWYNITFLHIRNDVDYPVDSFN